MIQAENIRKTYGEVVALEDISLEVKKGEIFGLIGPDGAGKTTFFRIVSSLLLPDKGTVRINDLDVIKDYRKIRMIVGYMPQRFSLYSDLTVIENLHFFATVFGTSIEKNYDLIRDVYRKIEPFRNRIAGNLSGGMKQKLALSCALIHEPKLLILDEPTTGVDAISRKEFWELLKNLKEKGITVLVSTPYMDEAKMCNRVALIQNGSILSIDTPKSIIKTFGRQLYALRSTDIYRLLLDTRKFPTCESVVPFGQNLHYTDKSSDFNQKKLLTYLKQNGHEDIAIEEIKPGIEDVFMKFMEQKNEAGHQNNLQVDT